MNIKQIPGPRVLQGRLIPGTSVATLPFIDALRAKAAVGKEALPEECFHRLRGALFLGPSWMVTRNKLKVRHAPAHRLVWVAGARL